MTEKLHNFPEYISSKQKAIVQLEFELAYYDDIVQYVSHGNSFKPHETGKYNKLAIYRYLYGYVCLFICHRKYSKQSRIRLL